MPHKYFEGTPSCQTNHSTLIEAIKLRGRWEVELEGRDEDRDEVRMVHLLITCFIGPTEAMKSSRLRALDFSDVCLNHFLSERRDLKQPLYLIYFSTTTTVHHYCLTPITPLTPTVSRADVAPSQRSFARLWASSSSVWVLPQIVRHNSFQDVFCIHLYCFPLNPKLLSTALPQAQEWEHCTSHLDGSRPRFGAVITVLCNWGDE